MNTTVNRRALVKGAAWAAPVVAATAMVPAFAASRHECAPATFKNSTTVGEKYNGKTYTSTNGDNSVTVSLSGSPTTPTNLSTGNNFNGSWEFRGWYGLKTGPATSVTTDFLDGASDMNLVMVMTQGRTTSNAPSTQTITFTFAQPVTEFSIPNYDMTWVTSTGADDNKYRVHQDELIFSQTVTASGAAASSLNTTTGTDFYLTQQIASQTANGSSNWTATYSGEPITSISITYTDHARTYTGWQFVGLGLPTIVC